MESKIIALLIKRGWNEKSAQNMVADNIKCAISMFPEAKAAKLAEVIICL